MAHDASALGLLMNMVIVYDFIANYFHMYSSEMLSLWRKT